MRAGSVLEGKENNQQPRADTLTSLWLHHIVACASGTPTTSVQIGLNGIVQFDALPQENAHQYLENLVALYAQAWQQPLPVSRKSACKYLSTLNAPHPSKNDDSDQIHAAALGAARQAFEGSQQRIGEWTDNASLQRIFKNFASIEAELPNLAHRLYGAIVQHARLLVNDAATLDEDSGP
jgi:exodeoxyribonuclease V gamma subunit